MQSTRKPMPVGVEDFKRLVTQGYCFIDKTRFIKDYIDAQGVVTLITRPRRFGKTLTLSMLQYFFDSEQGEENRQLFSGLDIEGAGERYMQEQGVSDPQRGAQQEFLRHDGKTCRDTSPAL